MIKILEKIQKKVNLVQAAPLTEVFRQWNKNQLNLRNTVNKWIT